MSTNITNLVAGSICSFNYNGKRREFQVEKVNHASDYAQGFELLDEGEKTGKTFNLSKMSNLLIRK